LGPAYKWASEFEKAKNNKKPIKIIHYCNNIAQRSENKYKPKKDWIKKLRDDKNQYLGLPCVCGNPKFFKDSKNGGKQMKDICNHSGGFNDPFVHGFLKEILVKDSGSRRRLKVLKKKAVK